MFRRARLPQLFEPHDHGDRVVEGEAVQQRGGLLRRARLPETVH